MAASATFVRLESVRPLAAALATATLAVASARAGERCAPQWSSPFSGAAGGVSGSATELLVFDDGSGPALHVAGQFDAVDQVAAGNVARFDGSSWSALGTGLDAAFGTSVNALGSYDFGVGERLVAAGMYSIIPNAQVAQWNGTQWTGVPGGLPGVWLASIGVFKGELYLSGPITLPGISYYIRWSGAQWIGVGSGLGSVVWDQKVHDDGGGPALFVTGIPVVNGVPNTLGIARWDGVQWSGLGLGINGEGRALAVFDDGDGPALYVGGSFTMAGGMPANRVARWRDGQWSAVGAGFDKQVLALTVFDDGDGPALHAAGKFTSSGGTPLNRVARWTIGPAGGSWQPLGEGVEGGDVHALAVFDDDGPGPAPSALYAAGDFDSAGGIPSPGLARWRRCATCAGDTDGSGAIDAGDLGAMLSAWGSMDCVGQASCPLDLDGDGAIGAEDLGILLGAWGPCSR